MAIKTPSSADIQPSSDNGSAEVLAGDLRLRLASTLKCAEGSDDPKLHEDLTVIEKVNEQGRSNNLYTSKHLEGAHEESLLPFRVSPDLFQLSDSLRSSLGVYGESLSQFYSACSAIIDELPEGHKWKGYLERNKPGFILEAAKKSRGNHIFLRPDLILTDGDPVLTEIETSPFGLALSHFLNVAYAGAGKKSLVDASVLPEELISGLFGGGFDGKRLCLAITEYTKAYKGQFAYLADALKRRGIDATVKMANRLQTTPQGDIYDDKGSKIDAVYRGFYLHEAVGDSALRGLIENCPDKIFPVCKPQLEEKALMAMLWDEEFEPVFRSRLGTNFEVLRRIIPPTWVLDKKAEPPKNFPYSISSWDELSKLSRKQRSFVLKKSGFSDKSSWAKGVVFLGKLSQERCKSKIAYELDNENDLLVLQEFRKGSDFHQRYFDFHNASMQNMRGRVRFTPYFSAKNGRLLTAKATMCENTDYIHATSESINVPVI